MDTGTPAQADPPKPEKEAKSNPKSLPKEPELYHGLNTKYAVYIIVAVFMLAGVYFILDFKMPTTGYATYTPNIMDTYITSPNVLKERYNDYSDDIPGILKFIFGYEKIRLVLMRLEGNNVTLAVTTSGGEIVDIKPEIMQNPTMYMWVKESGIKKLYESENFADDLEQVMEDGDIDYKSERVFTSVKASIIIALINIMSWFS